MAAIIRHRREIAAIGVSPQRLGFAVEASRLNRYGAGAPGAGYGMVRSCCACCGP